MTDITVTSLPKFKDKVMSVNVGEEIEQSYSISSSFKGILRLSPNNLSSINETQDIVDVPEEFYQMDTNYSDAIVFEGDAAVKSNASIERRMIIASDSDSYAVDLRISEFGVEFDNLNVVGISKFNHVTLFTKDSKESVKSFKLGNTNMMTLHNELSPKYNGLNYDIKDINVTDDGGDESFILSGLEKDGRRIFKYFKSKNFIEEIVMETLLDLQSVPTGSIHYVPVTLNQYIALSDNGNKKPNVWTSDTDPIIRDFLLCDGRLYNSKDFPELAKMLWNETITYWKPVYGDGKSLLHKFEHKNKFGENKVNDGSKPINPEKVFRVPDLRRMFISSLFMTGIDGYLQNASPRELEYNYCGYWMPDNLPMSQNGDSDDHFHFIAYGTYTPIISFPMENINDETNYNFVKGSKKNFDQVATEKGDGSMEPSKTPAILTLTNHLSWSKSPRMGPGFGHQAENWCRRKKYWGYEPYPGIAYLAGPITSKDKVKNYSYATPSVGRTSYAFLNGVKSSSNAEAFGTVDDVKNGEKYVSFDSNLHGHENAPKYVACLPLIKI